MRKCLRISFHLASANTCSPRILPSVFWIPLSKRPICLKRPKCITSAPIIPQDETDSPDHLAADELEMTNVPLLDILLPQEGAPPIIQRRQFNPAPLLDVPQAMEPPMALLLPVEDLTQSDALVADQQVSMPNPTRSGIHFYHPPTQFPGAEFAPFPFVRWGPNLFDATAPPTHCQLAIIISQSIDDRS
eukprot:Gb_07142 [translate_table: standard]